MSASHTASAVPRVVRVVARLLAVALVPLGLVGPLAAPAAAAPNSSTTGNTTSTSVTSSLNPSTVGQSVTFTATVTLTSGPNAGNAAPDESVTFLDGSTQLGTVTMTGGVAAFSTGALAQGTHPITASYSGFSTDAGTPWAQASTSSVLQQVVNASTTTTTAPGSPGGPGNPGDPSGPGGTTTTTAPGSPGGTTSTTVAPQPATTTTTAPGSPGGTTTTTPAPPPPTTTTVPTSGTTTKKLPTVTVTAGTNPVGAGLFTTFTVTVVGAQGSPTPTGTVSLDDPFSGTTVTLGSSLPLDSGGQHVLHFVNFSAIGAHPLTAHYQGDGSYLAADSPVLTQTVVGGTVTGQVTSLATGNAIVGAPVTANAPNGFGFGLTSTDSQGNYSLALGAGPWLLRAGPALGTEIPGHLNVSVPSGQTLAGRDFALRLPTPMPSGTTITGATISNGIPIIPMTPGVTIPVTTTQCPGGTVTLTITTEYGGALPTLNLVESPAGSGTYTVQFDSTLFQGPPLHNGAAVFAFTVTCPGNSAVNSSFDGYIDPSGTVVNQFGTPINGATVILQHSDALNGVYSAVPNGSSVMSPSNRVNPWTTKADGLYRWDVLPGFYRVVASAPGCTTLTSEHYAIPPEVTDLTLTLTCEVASKVKRFAGTDRIDTAVLVSQDSFAGDTANAVVLARADNFADALAAGPLAAARNAPLLLTATSDLDSRVRGEVDRVLPAGGTVVIAGGTGAVSEAVADALRADGFAVSRISGENRYATAVAIADAVVAAMGFPAEATLLATGVDFPDGLVAGAAAARLDGVVLLTSGRSMPAVTAAWLAAHPGKPTFAIGGPAAAAAPTATAVTGADRYATATAVASRFFTNPDVVGVVSGVAFPDALVGAERLGARAAPLVLTAPSALSPATETYLSGLSPRAARFEVYGGTTAISAVIDEALHSLAR